MAGTGMALRRGATHPSEGGDDVQSSIELLDRVLSEFDDMENANQVQNIQQMAAPTSGSTTVPSTPRSSSNSLPENNPNNSNNTGNVSSTPEDESPSLGGHQSEDDGYMSMNGRKARFALSFKPVTEVPVHQEAPGGEDYPPPPEEAERLIATLLPKVSPANSAKRNNNRRRIQNQTALITSINLRQKPQEFIHIGNAQIIPRGTATQTTLPKTRHQRPYGWENQEPSNFRLHPAPPPPGQRYASLPFPQGIPPIISPNRVPPRTVPTAAERHREVRRRVSEDEPVEDLSSDNEGATRPPRGDLADDERFSDDSLEEMLPPPPPVANKRSSIAWEVPLDQEDPLMTPGSTKVVGRRRRKSVDNSHSSTSSIPNRLKELDDWPEPPPCSTEDEVISPFSDSDDPVILPDELHNTEINGSGTYIIRRGKKDRKPVSNISNVCGASTNSNSSLNSRLSSDLSLAHSRFSADLNGRFSRELYTPNSRYSIDLSTPHSRLSHELNSPKSRYSLDLNNSKHLCDDLNSSSNRSSSEFRKHSTTFDNIKSLMKEGLVETFDSPSESCSDFSNPKSPLVRVVSLPTLSADEFSTPRRELGVTVEEEEDVESPRQNSAEISPLRKIERNISQLLERRDIDVFTQNILEAEKFRKEQQNEDILSEGPFEYDYVPGNKYMPPKRNGIQKSESAKEMKLVHHEKPEVPKRMTISNSADFPVKVEIVQGGHEFPPLPPSPVEEDEDEYSEILHPLHVKPRAETLPVAPTECKEAAGRIKDPPAVPPHREAMGNSLKTRSMDGGIGRGKRNNINSSSRLNAPERRTLPTDLPGTKRRTYNTKRSCQSPREEHHMQTSCSLPETPIFARGCDIPRTPHRRAPEIPGHRTTPRQSNTMGTLNMSTGTTSSSYRRGLSNSNLEQAIVGAELLRMAGGPGRGWYPRHRHPRPASIEHLDRLTPSHSAHNPWDAGSRKPLTLPPNLTPKFFQRSPREALRRVTSLLIRKGNGKEPKKEKEVIPPNIQNNEEGQKKKGFFKSLWKRSRHYSLEQ